MLNNKVNLNKAMGNSMQQSFSIIDNNQVIYKDIKYLENVINNKLSAEDKIKSKENEQLQ